MTAALDESVGAQRRLVADASHERLSMPEIVVDPPTPV